MDGLGRGYRHEGSAHGTVDRSGMIHHSRDGPEAAVALGAFHFDDFDQMGTLISLFEITA